MSFLSNIFAVRNRPRIIFIIIILSVFLFTRFSPYGKSIWLEQQIKSNAENQNLSLKFSEARISFLKTIKITNLSFLLQIGKLPLPLNIYFEEVNLAPKLLPFLLLSFDSQISANFYGGKLLVDTSYGLISKSLELDGELSDFLLENNPLGLLFQTKGKLNIEFKSKLIRPETEEPESAPSTQATTQEFELKPQSELKPVSSSLKLTIENGSYSGDYKIQNIFPIPKISELSLNSEVTVENENLEVKTFDLVTNLAKITFSGNGLLDKKFQLSQINLTGKISLTEEGVPKLEPYLKLAANIQEAKSRDWLFQYDLKDYFKNDLKDYFDNFRVTNK